jgi:hypothetical protein
MLESSAEHERQRSLAHDELDGNHIIWSNDRSERVYGVARRVFTWGCSGCPDGGRGITILEE